ncbi:hypothetical protein [Streptococcus parauberis]|uniref:hypothetical protein n=1 Tax=Streptococcus parauberis TaxID=1348 RepID=UPI00378A92B7
MDNKSIEEVERNEQLVRRELEQIENKKLVLKKSYDKAIDLQLDIQQSLREASQNLSPEEIIEQEDILSTFNRQSQIVEGYFQEETAKLNKQELIAKDKMEKLVCDRQRLFIDNSEKEKKDGKS